MRAVARARACARAQGRGPGPGRQRAGRAASAGRAAGHRRRPGDARHAGVPGACAPDAAGRPREGDRAPVRRAARAAHELRARAAAGPDAQQRRSLACPRRARRPAALHRARGGAVPAARPARRGAAGGPAPPRGAGGAPEPAGARQPAAHRAAEREAGGAEGDRAQPDHAPRRGPGVGRAAGRRPRGQGSAAMKAHVLVVDDDADLLKLLTMRLGAAGHRVSTVQSAEEALAQLAVERPQVVLSDVQLPGRDGLALFDEIRERHPSLPVILLTAHGTIPDAVEATARGVFSYLTKPFDGKALLDKIDQALAVSTPPAAQSDAGDEAWRDGIVSRSSRMTELLNEARLVARSDASVLLRGESGSGKELLARAIHRASPRASRPFVAVNCGAIPEALLESELFGHVKGSFTGALANHRGLFQAADGGTLLLDEIGDMPLPLQVKLLRVLQDRSVRPVGASQ